MVALHELFGLGDTHDHAFQGLDGPLLPPLDVGDWVVFCGLRFFEAASPPWDVLTFLQAWYWSCPNNMRSPQKGDELFGAVRSFGHLMSCRIIWTGKLGST